MTRKQFRESLRDTKVFVGTKSKEIQVRLFELGFDWRNVSRTCAQYLDQPFIYICGKDSTLGHDHDFKYFNNHKYQEITIDYILNTKIEGEVNPTDFVLVRNSVNLKWELSIFSRMASSDDMKLERGSRCYITLTGWFKECIPYKGNEDLLGRR